MSSVSNPLQLILDARRGTCVRPKRHDDQGQETVHIHARGNRFVADQVAANGSASREERQLGGCLKYSTTESVGTGTNSPVHQSVSILHLTQLLSLPAQCATTHALCDVRHGRNARAGLSHRRNATRWTTTAPTATTAPTTAPAQW